MQDIRRKVWYIYVLVLAALIVQQTWQWATTVPLYDLHGRQWGTIADWINRWLATWVADPLGIIFYSGWGDIWTRLPIFGLLIVVTGKLIGMMNTWRKHFPECSLIDANWRYISLLLFLVPIMLSIYGAGAKLNLFWDTAAKVPFYPWHDAAHWMAAFILFSELATIDKEGIFRIRFFYRVASNMGLAWLVSMLIENKENNTVLQYGLQEGMYNNIIDSLLVDHRAVLSGAFCAIILHAAINYKVTDVKE